MMAELLNEALKIILEKLISGAIGLGQTAQEIKSLFQDDPEKMMNTIEVFMVEVHQMQLTPQLEMLKKLGRVVQHMLDFQDESQTRIKRRKVMSTSSSTLIQKVFYLASSNPVVHAYKDARQFTSICKDLYLGPLARDIDGTRSLLDMMYKPPQRPTNSQLTLALASEEVIGRDGDRDKILSLLGSSTDPFSVLAITGIGGIGKTTLAQYLYSTECVKTKFDVLLWVEVGQDFDLEKVIREMVTFGTGERNLVDCEKSQLQNCILPLISGKKCLIVLDNVRDHRNLSWNWQELMKLNGYMGVGSRFIITTRSESVARIMSNNDPYRLGDLDAQDAWRLFQKVGFRQQPEPELDRIGREIAQLCGNVPLVLRVIGALLREKPTTVEEWSKFRNDLARRSCCGRESSIMHILKFSYDQLHPKGLKRCFLHLSLFPSGFRIEENDLIYQWRALGFVEKQENQSEMDAAQEYLLCLVNRGLLIHDWLIFYKMHDVIHDLATSLAKSKYKRVDSDDECDFGDETQHVSFKPTTELSRDYPSLFHMKDQLRSLHISRETCPLNLNGLSKYKHLRVLTLYSCVWEVPSTIGKLIHLRYLNMSYNCFTELSDSFTQLVNLVYLDLHNCLRLRKLPSGLSKLVDLEFLNLHYCQGLQELPRDINKLEKLWHLELDKCNSLKHMPLGLGKLTGLQTLSRFVVSEHSWINGDVSGIAELNSLNNLKGKLEIVVDGCCLPPTEVRAANLQAKDIG